MSTAIHDSCSKGFSMVWPVEVFYYCVLLLCCYNGGVFGVLCIIAAAKVFVFNVCHRHRGMKVLKSSVTFPASSHVL